MINIKDLINKRVSDYTLEEEKMTRPYLRLNREAVYAAAEKDYLQLPGYLSSYEEALADGDEEYAANMLEWSEVIERGYRETLELALDDGKFADWDRCDDVGYYVDFEALLNDRNIIHMDAMSAARGMIALVENVDQMVMVEEEIGKRKSFILSNKRLISKFNHAISLRVAKNRLNKQVDGVNGYKKQTIGVK